MAPRFTCRILGHRWEFFATGDTLRWWCGRGCDAEGGRRYGSPDEAERFAYLLNRSAPGPPLSLLSALGGTVHREPRRRSDKGRDRRSG